MSHARTQIRQAVVALLNGNTEAGNRVFSSRVHPLDDAKLPALLVYTPQENIGERSMQRPRTQQRQLQLAVEGYLKARGDIDAEADALALEVEQLIAADPTLAGLVKDISLESTATQLSGEGEKPVAVITLTFAVLYCVKENAPQTPV
jgi:hypothetical protein